VGISVFRATGFSTFPLNIVEHPRKEVMNYANPEAISLSMS
jgi:hypothetical protein